MFEKQALSNKIGDKLIAFDKKYQVFALADAQFIERMLQGNKI